MNNASSHSSPVISATDRRLLELLVTGASSKSIAEQLGLTDGTTRGYLHSLYKRIGVKNKTSAVTWFISQSNGLSGSNYLPAAAETFADRAVSRGLGAALGIMDVFLGPYGQMWDMLVRLGGAHTAPPVKITTRSRQLWSGLVSGNFAESAAYFDRISFSELIKEAPSDAVLLACSLFLGGYNSRANKALNSLKVKSGGRGGIAADEKQALAAISDVVNDLATDKALTELQRLADQETRRPTFRHLLLVVLFHIHRIRGVPDRAREMANTIWLEAESARKHLESMGDRTFPLEESIPASVRPNRMTSSRSA